MNAPDPTEHIVLDEEHKKVEYGDDKNQPDAGTFVVRNEDHTLGNMLRNELLRNPRVLFAGYRMPHPLEHRLVLKVRTDGSLTPIQATQQALASLKEEVRSMRAAFDSSALANRGGDDHHMHGMDY